MARNDKLIEHLNEINGLELALVQTLTAHIAMTPRGRYRSILERHREETREQASTIQARLRELGIRRNPLALVGAAANTVVGQALALGKAPIDLLRGSSGADKLLKNARDEIASEALEIGAYDALEALADGLGDVRTSELARLHRTQEERTLAELRAEIKHLAQDVVTAQLSGRSNYDVTRTGAADAVRDVAEDVGQAAGQTAAATRAAASDVAETVQETAEQAGRQARDAARSVPGEPEIEGQLRGVAADGDEGLAIKNYESLTVEQVLPKLKLLPELELAKIDAYERGHRNRKRVLTRIAALRERQPAGSAS